MTQLTFVGESLSIYLDHCATTPLGPEALAAMMNSLEHSFANPFSKHKAGQDARAEMENARTAAARLLGACHSSEVHFTSGATESIMRSFVSTCEGHVERILVGATEHVAVLEAAQVVAGARKIVTIPVTSEGELVFEALEDELERGAAFVSVGLVNNETGVMIDAKRVAAACARFGALLHFDGAQAIGRAEVNFAALDCDYLSLSPHKHYGPKGCGLWLVRADSPISTQIGHEGTPNVAGIAGSVAALAAMQGWQEESKRQGILRNSLEAAILSALPFVAINGTGANRAANISNIYFPRRSGADIVEALSRRGLYVSTGAACTTGGRPSHVIEAMGFAEERANGSVRFSLGRSTTQEDVNRAAALVIEAFHATLPIGGTAC